MIRLYDTGAYLVHGTDIIADDRDEAAKLKQAVGGPYPVQRRGGKGDDCLLDSEGPQYVWNDGQAEDQI